MYLNYPGKVFFFTFGPKPEQRPRQCLEKYFINTTFLSKFCNPLMFSVSWQLSAVSFNIWSSYGYASLLIEHPSLPDPCKFYRVGAAAAEIRWLRYTVGENTVGTFRRQYKVGKDIFWLVLNAEKGKSMHPCQAACIDGVHMYFFCYFQRTTCKVFEKKFNRKASSNSENPARWWCDILGYPETFCMK